MYRKIGGGKLSDKGFASQNLENFTNSDRKPPYIETYVHLFPHLLWKIWKKPLRNEPKFVRLITFTRRTAQHDAKKTKAYHGISAGR